MVNSLVLIALGVFALYIGGTWLVKSASRIAGSLGASVLFIGMTIVAWATSVPELVVSVSAASQGASDIAIGNVVGSNIANIGLCLSIMALITPITLGWDLLRRELPIMIGASVLAYLLSLDGVVGRVDGLILFAAFIGFSVLVYALVRQEQRRVTQTLETYQREESLTAVHINRPFEVGRLSLGLVLMIAGANWTVDGATGIARTIGVSELVIGLTVVALGTSLPEISASLVAAVRGQTDIAVGNVIGSNIANVLAILGITAIIQPIPVSESSLQVQMPFMIALSITVLLFGLRKLTRVQGALLLVIYIGFVVLTFRV
jgi:cation:H+ antiporter